MSIDQTAAKHMFEALKKLSDLAQESCLAFNETEVSEQLRKQHRHLMGEILGRTYEPFQRSLIAKFETLTISRLRERVQLPTKLSTYELLDGVVEAGESLLHEFGDLMNEGEKTGLFRKGGVQGLQQELQKFKQWLSENRASL